MTTPNARVRNDLSPREALVWIDHNQAVIVEQGPGGRNCVELLNRARTETEAMFDARAVDAIGDRDRVVVSGPAYARNDFERVYVSMTHRPDRLVDVEPTTPHESFIHRTI
jgi:hypothetical protein